MVANIDQSTPIPIYFQLKSLIHQQIKNGELRPGDKIPTEAQLCERYNISRTPVRQALLELAREGVLVRKAGSGTFVAQTEAKMIDLSVIVPDERWQWLLEEAAEVLNQDTPNSKINLTFITVPLTKLHDTLSFAVASGRAPDISILDSVWIAEFAHRRYLYAIEEVDADWVRDVQHRFYPSVLSANSLENTLYAIPTNADVSVLWYRSDWFRQERIPPPKTWEQLVEIGHYFKRPAIRSRYGLGTYPLAFAGGRKAGETTTYQLLPLLWSVGARVTDGQFIILNQLSTIQAMTLLQALVWHEELVTPQVIEYPWNGSLQDFAHGRVALAFGGTYENFLIQTEANWSQKTFSERVAFVPLPAPANGNAAGLVGGMTYGIYRQSQYPQESLALLKIALTADILKSFSLRTGQNATLATVANSIRYEEDGFLSNVAPLLVRARNRPSLPEYDRVSQQIQEMIELCLIGQAPIAQIVKRAADGISAITGMPVF